MKFLKQMRKNSRGFTLVEIIVVLVIIAIMAVTLIPSLTGYITDAQDKVAISEARTAAVAAQTIASELIGNKVEVKNIITYLKDTAAGDAKVDVVGFTSYKTTINTLSGASGNDYFTDIKIDADNGTVSNYIFKIGAEDKWVMRKGSTVSVVKDTAPTL